MALPDTIQTIVGLIGHAKAMQLVEDLGGQDFRFPVTRAAEQFEHLVDLIGPRAAERLHQHFSGQEVYIARCDAALRTDRNRLLIARYEVLLAQGNSSRGAVSVLVREFRLSNRQIEKIVNGPSPAGQALEMVSQGSLF